MTKQERITLQSRLTEMRTMYQKRIIKLNTNAKQLWDEYGDKIHALKVKIVDLTTELITKTKLLKQYEKGTAYDVDFSRLTGNYYGTQTPLLTKEAEDRVIERLKGKWRLHNIVSVNGVRWPATNIAIMKGDGADFVQVFPDGNEVREQGKLNIHYDRVRKEI